MDKKKTFQTVAYYSATVSLLSYHLHKNKSPLKEDIFKKTK